MGKVNVEDLLVEIRDILKSQFIVAKSLPKNDRFEVLADGWVKDKQLGLEWGPTYSKKMTWQEAMDQVAKDGCRLPTTNELFSLVDRTKYEPAIDKTIFTDTKSDWYWTADTCAWISGFAWLVGFYNGYVNLDNKDVGNYVRPVRSSQS